MSSTILDLLADPGAWSRFGSGEMSSKKKIAVEEGLWTNPSIPWREATFDWQ